MTNKNHWKLIGILFFLSAVNYSLFSENKLDTFSTIPPIAFFVEAIGGEAVKVNSIIDENGNPHTYAPTPKQVVALGRSEILFTIGLPFEKVLVKKIRALSKPPKIVDLTKGVKFRRMHGANEHKHNTHDCDHKGAVDPHIWLGPAQIKVIAANIADVLSGINPAKSAEFKVNLKNLLQKLSDLDMKITKQLLSCKGDTVFVYHPSFGYFTDAFGLKQEAVEIEGKSPSPRQIIKLIGEAKKDKVKVIFVQPQFDTNAAANIAKAIDGSVIPMNPLEKNVFKNMEYMAGKIAESKGKGE